MSDDRPAVNVPVGMPHVHTWGCIWIGETCSTEPVAPPEATEPGNTTGIEE